MTDERKDEFSALKQAEAILHESEEERSKYFSVELEEDLAQFMLAYFKGSSEWRKGLLQLEFWKSESLAHEADFFSALADRFGRIVSLEQHQRRVIVNLNYSEIDLIGRFMFPSKTYGLPVELYGDFLSLNAAFVKVGGKDNVELREAFEKLLNREVD